jgi:aspartate/tyrosine/aromatic aminotransferase
MPFGAPDPIFGLLADFKADPRPEKVNLLAGIYQNENLQPVVFEVVKAVKPEVVGTYLPIDGDERFIRGVARLIFGKEGHYGAQTVGGTGALRVAGALVGEFVKKKIAIPALTWPNHRQIFERSGLEVTTYDHYGKGRFDLGRFLQSLKLIPKGSAVLLHAACQNPTGADPSVVEWRAMAEAMKDYLPVFDFAYQGLGDGIEEDAFGVRTFVEAGLECLIAYSCSKNFGLYSERVGALFVVAKEEARIASQVKRQIRAMVSNPPAHGAKIVATILEDQAYREQWRSELDQMRRRIGSMREELLKRLPGWERCREDKGMFTLLDLSGSQVDKLRKEHAIFLPERGRLNLAGLNRDNIDYVARAIVSL